MLALFNMMGIIYLRTLVSKSLPLETLYKPILVSAYFHISKYFFIYFFILI